MNFGSKYVYNYSDSEEECVSDEEFQEGMTRQLSEDDEDSDTAVQPSGSTSKSDGGPSSTNARGGGSFMQRLFGKRDSGNPELKRTASESSSKKKRKHHWLSLDVADSEVHTDKVPSRRLKGKKWRRADTNVINVKFDTLKSPSNMHTGDPFHCSGCETVLSKESRLEECEEEDLRKWKCEFCGVVNDVDLVDEEIPHADDTTFMLTPAPTTAGSGRSGEDDSLVIFCVDTSGSMCVTTEVPGSINLRGSRLDRLQSLNDTRESQYLPRQRHNVTYVSRLQGVQAAVDHQLGEMQKEHPNRRVVLITFNSEVTVVGDGSIDPCHVSGDKLGNKEELIKIGSELGMPKQVKESRDMLGNKVFDLEEGGQTALGPALMVAVSMACQVPGSKVIICTDGLANVGLGTLDNKNGDNEAYDQASDFYDDVSELAADKGVSVSVISIQGTDCKMVELGKVADATGGQVNIVDPLKLTQEFGSILADPIIATNVAATLQLHKGLYFRFEESEVSKVTRYVGNVTKESEITFEYGVRQEIKRQNKKKADKSKIRVSTVKEVDEEAVYDNASGDGNPVKPGTSGGASTSAASNTNIDLNELKELPFQLRITYTDLEGGQALRVLTQKMPITRNRKEAEKAMDMATVGAHATKQSAALALQGDYTTSRLNAFMYQRLLHRRATTSVAAAHDHDHNIYDNFYEAALPMENRMNLMQQGERSTRGRTYSESEDSDSENEGLADEAKGGKGLKKAKKPTLKGRHLSAPTKQISVKSVSRRKECDDTSANMFYQNAQVSSKGFMSKKK